MGKILGVGATVTILGSQMSITFITMISGAQFSKSLFLL
jgi:hypothetical protein